MDIYIKYLLLAISIFMPNMTLREKVVRTIKEKYSKKILCRTACLGNFALANIDWGGYLICNHQKNRVDYCLEIDGDKKKRINISSVLNYTPREHQHLLSVYVQERNNIFKYTNVKAIIMDSFSELTDQMFKSKYNNSLFCTHYANVLHNTEFNNEYECLGLLPSETLEKYYSKFFCKLRNKYKNIPIIFINFPAKYDDRQKFKERAINIKNVINRLSRKYKIKVLTPDYVERNIEDNAVYHFSKESYLKLSKEIMSYLKQKFEFDIFDKNVN